MWKLIRVTAVILVVLLVISGCSSPGREPAPDSGLLGTPENGGTPITEVHFLDVGQGDAIFVQLPDGGSLLVDAGPPEAGSKVVGYLKQLGVATIDIVVATHPHADHIGGMAGVIRNFPIGKFYSAPVVHTTATFESMLTALEKANLKVTPARAGQVLWEASEGKARVLAPRGNFYEDLNNFSVVLKLTVGSVSFLLTGDAELLSEKEMMEAGEDLEAQILKVAHHGSSSSTGAGFLARTRPKIAAISAGRGNEYGHPHQEILDRLSTAGVAVLRTDVHGTIRIRTDGKTIWIGLEVNPDLLSAF